MNQPPFTLEGDGDALEQASWKLFVADHFPSYESFWVDRIVPLTYRVVTRGDIRFRPTAELAADGFTDEDVTVAQLHYTVLLHLSRVHEVLTVAAEASKVPGLVQLPFDRNAFFEAFTRLSSVSDVADELLARRASPGTYAPWSEKHGEDARRAWRKVNPDPLRPIRAYRNRLVHGRVVPELQATAYAPSGSLIGMRLFYPRVDHVDKYLDWRVAFDDMSLSAMPGPGSAVPVLTPPADFVEASVITEQAWTQVVDYVESAWQAHLL
jgi:hypothetical protein